jgi:nucleoside-diphosphate-sugar epimerase
MEIAQEETKTTLVLGGTGKTGRRVMERLTARPGPRAPGFRRLRTRDCRYRRLERGSLGTSGPLKL